MERAVVRLCASSAPRNAERFRVAQDCRREAPIWRKDDAFGNPQIDRPILKKGALYALQRPSKVLRQRADYHDPLLLFLPANFESSHRDNTAHRAEHDLPTVGVCVAGATPPVDKSTIVYLSCFKNKRSPVGETKPTPTQIEELHPTPSFARYTAPVTPRYA